MSIYLLSVRKGLEVWVTKCDPLGDCASPGEGAMFQSRTMSFSQASAWTDSSRSIQCLSSCVPSACWYCRVQTGNSVTGEAAHHTGVRTGLLGPQKSELAYFFFKRIIYNSASESGLHCRIWSEPALLKASFGNAGGGCLHIISPAWKKHLTKCVERVQLL